MPGLRTRLCSGLLLAALSASANAQWDSCGCGGSPMMAAPAYAVNPCPQPVVSAFNPCACIQAIPQTVYRDVPVTEYRPVKKTVQRPVVRTVYEDRPVTVYRQVMETKTVDVPITTYQTVTECRQQCINRSHWRTVMQPVPKMAACQYDGRAGLLGEFNRLGYSMRQAFTPNYIPRREFVPNVQVQNVPVQRVVAVPSTRQVTYNVPRTVAENTTQRVAVLKTDYEDAEVTVMEPFTTTKRMAVGTSYQYAYIDPFGGTTATAANPTPATAEEPVRRRTADGEAAPSGGPFEALSYPRTHEPEPEPTPAEEISEGPVAQAPRRSTPSIVRAAGWRPARKPAPPIAAPERSTDEPTSIAKK